MPTPPVIRWKGSGLLPLALAGVLLGVPPELGAQEGWGAEVQAARSGFGGALPDAVSTHASVGLGFNREHRRLHASVATPLGGEDLTWGFLSLSDRLSFRRGRFEAGVDLAALGHAQRDASTDLGGSGVRAELLPMVSASIGSLVAEFRSGASSYRGRIGEASWTRNLHQSELAVSRSHATASGGAVRLEGELRHLRPGGDEASYSWAGLRVLVAAGRSSWWASGGRWLAGLDADAPATAFGGGVSWALAPATTLSAAVRREPFDPAFLGTDRTSWGVALRQRLGASRPAPPSSGAERRSRERWVLRVPLETSPHPPGVAGDFTDWEVRPLYRRGQFWETEIALSPGVYHYAFRTRDGTWFVPPSTRGRRDDGMGGWVAVLVVPEIMP